MGHTSLDTILSDSSSKVSDWVKLAQLNETSNFDISDVYSMWLLARSGQSSKTYRPDSCSVTFEGTIIRVTAPFHVLVSEMGKEYTLESNLGFITPEKVVYEKEKSQGVILKSTTAMLDYAFKDPTISQLIPAYDASGNVVEVQLSEDKGVLQANKECTTAVTVAGEILAYEHYLEWEYNTETAYAGENYTVGVTDLDLIVTLSYVDDNGETTTEQLSLELDSCIESALAFCEGKPNLICHRCEGTKVNIYVNSCTGKVIKEDVVPLYSEGEDRWCTAASLAQPLDGFNYG